MPTGTVNIGKRASSAEVSPQLDGYTQVILNVTDDLRYTAGRNTGRTLELICPWGSQTMANNILAQIKGYQYQPYSASGAKLDPAAELGDGLTINGVYGGLYRQEMQFDSLCSSSVEAQHDEEIDHEYPYKSSEQRQITRQNAYVKSQLTVQADKIAAEVKARESADAEIQSTLDIQADEISAKVSKSGGSSSSFGWTLTDNSWTLKSNGGTVLQATKNGLEVKGKITATSGAIGGFTINSNSISYNNQTWGGTNSQGIYIGPNGIQLGKNFKVDSAGNLTAASGKFTGTVYANRIQAGGDAGYISGGQIGSGEITGGGGGNLAYGTVEYGNTRFTATLDQVGVNASNIYELAGRIDNLGGSITTSQLVCTSSMYIRSMWAGWRYIPDIGEYVLCGSW